MRTPHLTGPHRAGAPLPRRARSRGNSFATACVAAFAMIAVAGLASCKVRTSPAPSPGTSTEEPDPGPSTRDHRDDEPVTRDHRDGDGDDDAVSEPSGGSSDDTGGGGDGGERELLVDEDHEQYARVEGTSYDNSCETDADCHTGGCSSEICSAEPGVNSTCIMPAGGFASQGGSCGCVEGTCSWYRGASGGETGGDEGDGDSGRPEAALEGQGESCQDGECSGPLTCVKYYGVAGRKGPEFSSCEIPCPRGGEACPDGQTCVTIADGPGRVCRAR